MDDAIQSIYLFQFRRGKEKINRFYTNKYRNGPDSKLLKIKVKSLSGVENPSISNIADIIETNCLEEQFDKIDGIKTCLPSYKKIIRDAFLVEVINKKGACRILSSEDYNFKY